MSDELRGYDSWKTTEPEDRYAHGPEPYRCTVCDWHGRGGLEAYDHHRETTHPVRASRWPAGWPNAQFTCCAEQQCGSNPQDGTCETCGRQTPLLFSQGHGPKECYFCRFGALEPTGTDPRRI